MTNKNMLLVALLAAAVSYKWDVLFKPANQGSTATVPATPEALQSRFRAVAGRGADRVAYGDILQTDEDVVRCVELAFMVEFDGKPPGELENLQADLAKALGHGPEDPPKPLNPATKAAAAAVLRKYSGEAQPINV